MEKITGMRYLKREELKKLDFTNVLSLSEKTYIKKAFKDSNAEEIKFLYVGKTIVEHKDYDG